MKENKVKKVLKEGRVVIGTMVHDFAFPPMVQIFATAGFDCVVIDAERSFFNPETVNSMIWAAKAAGIVPIVRVASRKYHYEITKPLDAGAQGLLFPRVETGEELKEIIKNTKYFPSGQRGYHVGFAEHDYVWPKSSDEVPRLMKQTNEESLILLQVGTKLGIENIDTLLSVEGVDVATIAPADLSQSLGIPGQTQHPELLKCIYKLIEACRKHGVVSGHHVPTIEQAKKWIREGMRFMLVSNDTAMVINEATRLAGEMRDFLATR